MRFDWRNLCETNGVMYREGGASTAKNNIYVDCPFCSDGAGKTHMGLSTLGSAWGCWKSSSHRGKSPVRLIKALLRIGWEQAEEHFKDGGGRLITASAVREKLDKSYTPPVIEAMYIPDHFYEPAVKDYIDVHGYLRSRGFGRDTQKVLDYYELFASKDSNWKYRLIIPFFKDETCVGWTGRAITSNANLRYKTHPEGEQATNVVFNYDHAAAGGRVLVLCEGPLDAMKIDFYGRKYGIRAIALLGLALTSGKMKAIMELASRFDSIVLMLDRGALKEALLMKKELAFLRVRSTSTPYGAKDPGELKPAFVREWAEAFE